MKARPTRAVSVGLLTCVFVLTGCSRDAITPRAAVSGSFAATTSGDGSSGAGTPGAGSTAPGAGDGVRSRSAGFTGWDRSVLEGQLAQGVSS